MDHAATGRRVVTEEAQALAALADALDGGFDRAVATMLAATGRVVVSGMGKSGHVARKIAATLASTGTPAQFVHPAEASHGDLGMMLRGDVVLCLSNSGETAELGDLVAHTRRFAIPLLAMTAEPSSALGRAADVVLRLPRVAEACGVGIVPTTSTTMMLALGDALAIALMQARDFGPDSFRTFHPGGKLGARLAPVAALMHRGEALPLVAPDAPMADVLVEMTAKGFGVAGVVEGGRLAGIVTDGDLRRHMDGLLGQRAGDVMTRAPRTIAPDALAEEALARMQAQRITCLFVTDPDGGVEGLIQMHDCVRAGLG